MKMSEEPIDLSFQRNELLLFLLGGTSMHGVAKMYDMAFFLLIQVRLEAFAGESFTAACSAKQFPRAPRQKANRNKPTANFSCGNA